MQALTWDDIGAAREVINLPDLIRGYESIKEAGIAEAKRRAAVIISSNSLGEGKPLLTQQ
jgi:hypothetical protein